MYGLLLEAMFDALRERHGEEILEEIKQAANIEQIEFITHDTYSEDYTLRLANAVSMATGFRLSDVMTYFGYHFVTYTSRYGYDFMLRVLGRNLRDFLNGLDNLHDYLRMSYPKMCPPSFFSEKETKDGLIMHYRSKRKGYVHYVMGQIQKVAKQFYETEVEIEILEHEESNHGTHCVMKLHFDNRGFEMDLEQKLVRPQAVVQVKNSAFLAAFPFHILFGRNLVIKSLGKGIQEIIHDAIGKRVDHVFEMTKPPIAFSFEEVAEHTNIIFEMNSRASLPKRTWKPSKDLKEAIEECDEEHNLFRDTFRNETANGEHNSGHHLRLKGQMRYVKQWDCFMYLGSPILESLQTMFDWGLYVNDLSMHDASRDYVMIGTHQSKELQEALSQQKLRTQKMEELMSLLKTERKRTDTLLYQMIPKEVARSLRKGDPAVNTCRTFNEVTIMFSEVVDFNKIANDTTPMDIVELLNNIYIEFDALTERHQVYKVETINDVYMVAGGVPIETPKHAVLVCLMAMSMLESIKKLKHPREPDKEHIQVKIGMHCGSVVAGVVGVKMPRYCLFGDPVNTASRMESNGEGMKIHASETVKPLLEEGGFVLKKRGTGITVKGKGMMNTYWVEDYKGEDPRVVIAEEAKQKLCHQREDYDPDDYGGLGSSATFSDIQKSHLSMRSGITASSVQQTTEENDREDDCSADEAMYSAMANKKRGSIILEPQHQHLPVQCTSGTCSVQ